MPTDLPEPSPAEERDALDRELLLRVAHDRDVAAMEALYVRFKPRLGSFLRRLTRDESLIEEAFNDVMVKVWDKASQYQERSKVSSWIFAIAYRTCLRMVKKQTRRDLTFQLMGDDLPEVAAPGDDMDAIDGHPELQRAVKTLSAKHRIVVELCYFEGYALDEISHIVDVPVNTVKTRLHHARRKMRELLSSADPAPGHLSERTL